MNFISKLFYPITAPIRFIQNNFKTVLFLTILYFVLINSHTKSLEHPNLQIIELNGPIMNADDILEKIEIAKNDQHIKGVLFKVNSPGGAVAPSVEISYAIKELNAIKPVVAYASGTMASGSYLASLYATSIVANPGSMIGSIGVIMKSVDVSKLMARIGVKSQVIKAGTYKEVGTPTRAWTPQEKQELQKVTQNTYNLFVSYVIDARKLKKENQKLYADAHIFTAFGAKKVKLIDEVAPISKAKELVVQLSKVKKPIWSKEDKMEKFLQKLITHSISNISTNISGLMAF